LESLRLNSWSHICYTNALPLDPQF
jgi:hypothetical protein